MKGFFDVSALFGLFIVAAYFLVLIIVIAFVIPIGGALKYFELKQSNEFNVEIAPPSCNDYHACFKKSDQMKQYWCQQCLNEGPFSGQCNQCAISKSGDLVCSMENICYFDFY